MAPIATIQATLALFDGMSSPLKHITSAMNVLLNSFEAVQSTSQTIIDTASIQYARDEMAKFEVELDSVSQSMNRVSQTPFMPVHAFTPTVQPQVFQTAGMERYRQETQSAIKMIDRLSAEQARLSIRAQNIKLFPDNMAASMDSMYHRVFRVRGAVEQMASRKVGSLGAEQANAQFEILRGKMSTAIQEQDRLNQAMQQGDISMACASYEKLDRIINAVEVDIRQNTSAQDQFNTVLNNSAGAADNLWGKVKGMVGAYAGLAGAQKLIGLADSMSTTKARLSLIVDDGGSVQAFQDEIMRMANRSRTSFQSASSAVANMGIMAKDAFSNNNELIAFTELLNKQFSIAGTNAAGASAATLQLTQAMASGVLRGEELNSVFEQAPTVIQSIADYMNVPLGQIRNMAEQGQITADIVKNAMFASADSVNARFAQIPMTFEQLGTVLGNTLLQTFEPVIQIIGQGAQFIYDNWSTLEPVFWGLAGGMVFFAAATWIATGAAKAFFAALLTNPFFWIAMVIGVVIMAIYKWVQSVGGLKVAWLICSNALLTAWDLVKIGFYMGIFQVINWFNQMVLTFQEVSTNVQNFMGDMKAGVLTILQNMVNGAVGIINDFIGVLNKIDGVNIGLVSQVTFGTAAQLDNAAEKAFRNLKLDIYRNEVTAGIAERDRRINSMRADASAAANLRQIEIDAAKRDALAKQSDSGFNMLDYTDPGAGIADNVKSIADNTGKIADDFSYAEEDLKYLRDIAERETINRFTTAEIHIEQHNENNIASDMDIDGIMDAWTRDFAERLDISAEGVHV